MEKSKAAFYSGFFRYLYLKLLLLATTWLCWSGWLAKWLCSLN
jgi:hypothetical protein